MGRQSIIAWRAGTTAFNWASQTVVIVGSGPSAARTNLDLVRGRAKVIAINLSWRLAPWADVLYGSDGMFWWSQSGVPEFTRIKFTSSPFAGKYYGLQVLFTEGNNSGMRAIRLAEALGAVRVLLVGYDHHVKDGSHWHAPYGGRLHNPGKSQTRMWCIEMEKARFALSVINCTPGSALTCFPIMSLDEALNGTNAMECRADKPRHRAVS